MLLKKILKIALIVGLGIFLIALIITLLLIYRLSSEVSLDDLDKTKLMSSINQVQVYDTNGKLLNQNNYIRVSELNDYTKQAFISIEDKNFYQHNGLNYKRMCKALLNNIKSGKFSEGASTISQQLVKNTQLSNDKTIERKLKEIYITQELEKEYSKDEILEMYLNVIYFGNSSYGIGEAANNYFGKNAADLTLSESAVLAGIIKSPKIYSPILNYDNSISRRDLILKEMYKDGYITEEQYETALAEDVVIVPQDNIVDYNSIIRYDYMSKALTEASKILGISIEKISNEKYQIYTYMDSELQNELFNIVNSEQYKVVNSKGNECQGVLCVVDNSNNTLVAYSSNTNYSVANLIRQPGSAIKPIIVYAPALEEGLINPMTKILDEKIDIDGYSPKNVGNVYHGMVSIRDSVAYSLNIPAIKIMQELGLEKAKHYGEQVGINFDTKDNGYAIALGGMTNGITLENLTNSYTVFANSGYYKPLSTIKCIKNKYGICVYLDNRTNSKVFNDDTAYLTTSLLQDGVRYGTSKRLNTLPFDVAGKTGTVAVPGTNNNTDAISIAYTTGYTVGSWLGNYTLDPAYNLDGSNNGGTFATSMLRDVLECIYQDDTPRDFDVPDNIVRSRINGIVYERTGDVVLADANIGERYVLEDVFSKRYLPPKSIDNTIEINFETKYENDKVIITFDSDKYCNYDIIRINNNQEKTIHSVSNTTGKVEWIDNVAKLNGSATYYIKYKSAEMKYSMISKKYNIDLPEVNNSKGYTFTQDEWLFG